MNQLMLAIIIIVIVYFFIFTSKRIRTTSPFLGATVAIFLGLISFETAISYIDFSKLGIILGIMILTTIAKDSGIFQFLAIKVMRYSYDNPWKLFILLSLLTGILSSIFDENDWFSGSLQFYRFYLSHRPSYRYINACFDLLF